MKNILRDFAPGIIKAFLFLTMLVSSSAYALGKCLYVSSYHKGYAWSDGVELGLRTTLKDSCEIHQIDMDTKRNKGEAYIQSTARSVRDFINQWQPDVVITSDDNAAKFVIQQYFRDAETPFVFSGVNWTVSEYGFPYRNVTGMIEVAPLEAMLSQAAKYSSSFQAVYLGADTLTERKNLKRVEEAAHKLGIMVRGRLVPTAGAWKNAYLEAQNNGFIVLGSHSGIKNWDKQRLSDFAIQHAGKLTVTSHQWMMPYSSIGYTKIPQEHGTWAALAAIEILNGSSPGDIPIVANRKWDLWLNNEHLKATGVKLPRKLKRKAKKVIVQ